MADRVHKHTKVWALYLDLEESLGTVDSCRAAYEKVLELKVRYLWWFICVVLWFLLRLEGVRQGLVWMHSTVEYISKAILFSIRTNLLCHPYCRRL